MKLFIAEKPSLGRAIAAALPKPHSKSDGHIKAGNGDIVSWCIGHLLEQAEPDAYDPGYKKWQMEHLPILPSSWKLSPISRTRKQFSILKKLIKQADQIVHCGDPDREGQLLVDEVIDHVGVKKTVKMNIQRCLISDLNLPSVKKSLSDLKANKDFAALSISALARSRADWLYGINMTRAYTLQGQKVGFSGVVSVGRVQTPLLGLVVRRDQEIDAFSSAPYFDVIAHVTDLQSNVPVEPFLAKWQPSEACLPYMDSEGRVLNKALAENVVSRIKSQLAKVTKVENKHKKQAAPLPYNLSALQIDAAKRYGLSAKSVLDTCQSLYEKHKAITYPRSDNRYLPVAHFQQALKVINAISLNSGLNTECGEANVSIKSKAWNDAKTGAHHAIIPTMAQFKKGLLSKPEQQIYELISRQYLGQFYPHWEYIDSLVELTIVGGKFITKARHTKVQGWKKLTARVKSEAFTLQDRENKVTPNVKLGQELHCERGELIEKETQAPAAYTDATLLSAMTGISRYVSNPEIKKILKETDGLGTEATRANIIELLFKRQFLQRQGKQIKSTPAGRGLINSLPESMTLPDMTAQWESVLDKVSLREHNYDDFMNPLQATITGLIGYANNNLPTALKGIKQNRPARKKGRSKPYKKRN